MLVVARIVLMTLLNQLAWFPPSGAPPPYAESWLEACLSVTPATRREGSAPANAESRSGHGIMVPTKTTSSYDAGHVLLCNLVIFVARVVRQGACGHSGTRFFEA